MTSYYIPTEDVGCEFSTSCLTCPREYCKHDEENIGGRSTNGKPRFEIPLRSDSLPENHVYTDQGCDLEPACLTCSRPACRYDGIDAQPQITRSISRKEQCEALNAQGRGPFEIAAIVGISRRQVYRLLSS